MSDDGAAVLKRLEAAVIDGREDETPGLVQEALAAAIPAGQVLSDGLLSGMSEVGRRFREGDYFLPEVLVSGHHARVREWRLAEAERITRERRPDMWERYAAQRGL